MVHSYGIRSDDIRLPVQEIGHSLSMWILRSLWCLALLAYCDLLRLSLFSQRSAASRNPHFSILSQVSWHPTNHNVKFSRKQSWCSLELNPQTLGCEADSAPHKFNSWVIFFQYTYIIWPLFVIVGKFILSRKNEKCKKLSSLMLLFNQLKPKRR